MSETEVFPPIALFFIGMSFDIAIVHSLISANIFKSDFDSCPPGVLALQSFHQLLCMLPETDAGTVMILTLSFLPLRSYPKT